MPYSISDQIITLLVPTLIMQSVYAHRSLVRGVELFGCLIAEMLPIIMMVHVEDGHNSRLL